MIVDLSQIKGESIEKYLINLNEKVDNLRLNDDDKLSNFRQVVEYKWNSGSLDALLKVKEEYLEHRSIVWRSGPFGLTFKANAIKNKMTVHSVTREDYDIPVGSILNSIDGVSVDRDNWRVLFQQMKKNNEEQTPQMLDFIVNPPAAVITHVHGDLYTVGVKIGYQLASVNGKSTSGIHEEEINEFLENIPKPCILRFEIPKETNHVKRSSSLKKVLTNRKSKDRRHTS